MIAKGTKVKTFKETYTKKDGGEGSRNFLLISTEDQYNPNIVFYVSDKAIEAVEKIANGCPVEVEFNLGSKESGGRWFTNAQAWKVTKIGDAPYTPPSGGGNNDNDDLPF